MTDAHLPSSHRHAGHDPGIHDAWTPGSCPRRSGRDFCVTALPIPAPRRSSWRLLRHSKRLLRRGCCSAPESIIVLGCGKFARAIVQDARDPADRTRARKGARGFDCIVLQHAAALTAASNCAM